MNSKCLFLYSVSQNDPQNVYNSDIFKNPNLSFRVVNVYTSVLYAGQYILILHYVTLD